MDNQYLDFDEAVAYLKTNASTLYKWLQAGKVPGHKLGRQWRFVREELELYLSGKGPDGQTQKDAAMLAEFLAARAGNNLPPSDTQPGPLVQNLLRDALSQEAYSIQFYPTGGRYEIAYRLKGSIKKITEISENLFNQIHHYLVENSFPRQDEEARGFYLQKNPGDADSQINIQYQKLDTVTGIRVTLRFMPHDIHLFEIGELAKDAATAEMFNKWLQLDMGIIVVSGVVGNGMTTVTCSFLNHVKNAGKSVFLIEDYSEFILPGISQVEVIHNDSEDIARSMKQILASDADCVGLIISGANQPDLFKAAFRAASSGHLAILQIRAPSCEVVAEKIRQYAPEVLESKIKIGISSQTLLPNPEGGRRAEFTLLELNQ
ncbi:MAG: type secretory pathway, ATPase PulE/Tfp pilus assembly pathway, ATPase PilB [Alphaproteobacteria bacterium]|nr:type secretory pathway, ATPase PulE/Tfp pilus assembly pathway, ATPase PilB [Alphaproteobacteria bacterium]